jgi:hypothetical protein
MLIQANKPYFIMLREKMCARVCMQGAGASSKGYNRKENFRSKPKKERQLVKGCLEPYRKKTGSSELQ